MTELTELENAVAMDTALYNEIESLLPKDGVIDDTCSLINELMYLIKRREKAAEPRNPEEAEIDAWIASLPDDPKAVEAIIDRLKPWCCGAFTGWKGHTGDSKITLDEAEDHFTSCMLDMQDDLRRFLLTKGKTNGNQ